jgi:hypothetical protein
LRASSSNWFWYSITNQRPVYAPPVSRDPGTSFAEKISVALGRKEKPWRPLRSAPILSPPTIALKTDESSGACVPGACVPMSPQMFASLPTRFAGEKQGPAGGRWRSPGILNQCAL